MSAETLSLLIDLLFAATGIALVAGGLVRRSTAPAAEPAPAASWLELVLTAGGLAVAAVGPNILVVALTPGMPKMPVLSRLALLPSIAVLVVIWGFAVRKGLPRLANRIASGLWVGAAATGVLDVIRLTGFHLGQMPGNMPRMFGTLILDQMALGPSLASDLLGYLYHYWVGACFGLTYTLLVGRFRWWGGLVWGLLVEIGMMTTAPMVVAMDTGYFGVKFGPGLLVTSLLAHLAFGAALGLLAARYLRHEGTVLGQLRELIRR